MIRNGKERKSANYKTAALSDPLGVIENDMLKYSVMFHNIRSANVRCSSKAKMSALSKVGKSVFYLLVARATSGLAATGGELQSHEADA
jgi:hypothetical protein